MSWHHWFYQKLGLHDDFYEFQDSFSLSDGPKLSSAQKNDMKKHLLHSIRYVPQEDRLPADLERIAQVLQKIDQNIVISPYDKAIIREKLLAKIEKAPVLDYAFGSNRSLWHWKGFAGAMVFILTLSSILIFPVRIPATFASTYIEDVNGTVSVIRNGQIFKAQKDFVLQENDLIVTGKRSLVTVHFVDEATGRLGESGKLSLKRVQNTFSELDQPSTIEVHLEEGRLWTRVFDMNDEKVEFIVQAHDTKAVVKEKAAFDVKVLPDKEVVTVFENKVDVAVHQDITLSKSNPVNETVSAGFQAEISKENGISEPQVKSLTGSQDLSQKEQQWFSANLEEDKKKEQILASTQQAQQHESAEEESAEEDQNTSQTPNDHQQSADPTQPVPTQNNENTEEVEDTVLIAKRIQDMEAFFGETKTNFLRGQNFLLRNQAQEGMKNIILFEKVVRNYLSELHELETKDPEDALYLKNLMKEEVTLMASDLSSYVPGDSLYPAKESLEALQLLFADNSSDRLALLLEQTSKELEQMQQLITNEQLEQAERLATHYEDKVEQLHNLKISDSEQQTSLLQQFAKHLEYLSAFEKTLAQNSNGTELLARLRKDRMSILQNALGILDVVPDSSSQDFVKNLQALFGQYESLESADKEFYAAVKGILEQKKFLKPVESDTSNADPDSSPDETPALPAPPASASPATQTPPAPSAPSASSAPSAPSASSTSPATQTPPASSAPSASSASPMLPSSSLPSFASVT